MVWLSGRKFGHPYFTVYLFVCSENKYFSNTANWQYYEVHWERHIPPTPAGSWLFDTGAGMTTKLIGLNDKTGETFQIELNAEEEAGSKFEAVKRLFKKALGEPVGNANWWAGVPGQDRAVVWQGTTYKLHQHYLHVSFSDGRTW